MKAIQAVCQSMMHSTARVRAHRKVALNQQLRDYARGELGKVLEMGVHKVGPKVLLRLTCSNGAIDLEITERHGFAAIAALQSLECNLPAEDCLDMDYQRHAGDGPDQGDLNAAAGRALIVGGK